MLALLPTHAFAKNPGPATPSALEEEDPSAQFDLAEQRYREGRYEEAAEILSALAASFPDPILFYNLGRAYESAGELEAAVRAYSRYLELSPTAVDADAVRARAGRLRERADAVAASKLEQPQQPPPPRPLLVEAPRPPRRSFPARAAPWTLAGLGGGGLLAGVGVAVSARARNRSAQDEPTQARAADLELKAQNLALAANITFAVAGALTVAGLSWGFVRLRRDRVSKRTVGLPALLRF